MARKSCLAQHKQRIIARGRRSHIIESSESTVVKLPKKRLAPEVLHREIANTSAAQFLGVSVPGELSIVTIDSREGIEMERMQGHTVTRMLKKQPWKIISSARQFAETHHRMHCTRVDTETAGDTANVVESLSQQKSLLRSYLEKSSVEGSLRRMTQEDLDTLPEGDSLCHGDFHPNNVLVSNGSHTVLDWPLASKGNPLLDVCTTYLILSPGVFTPFRLTSTPAELARVIFRNSYFHHYCKLSDASPEDILRWSLLVAVARLGSDYSHNAFLFKLCSHLAAKRIEVAQ